MSLGGARKTKYCGGRRGRNRREVGAAWDISEVFVAFFRTCLSCGNELQRGQAADWRAMGIYVGLRGYCSNSFAYLRKLLPRIFFSRDKQFICFYKPDEPSALIDFAPLFISIAPKEITQDRNACSWLLTGTRRRFCCSKWFLLQTQQTNSRLGQNGSQHEDRQTDMNTFSMYGGVTVRSFLTKQENIYEIIATTKKWNAWVCGTATRRLFHAHRPEPY